MPSAASANRPSRVTGATSRSGLAIRITVRREEAGLLIEIANTGRWVEAADRGSTPSLGIGLENLRQRLQRTYPGSHEFTTTAADGWVHARLRLALPQNSPAPAR